VSSLGRGVELRGQVWAGGAAAVESDGVVLVDGAGVVRAIGSAAQVVVPGDVPSYGGAGHWVGPGVIDAHVHLAFATSGPGELLAGGVVGARDLGAPLACAREWRAPVDARPAEPRVWVVGPLLTAPGGYPSRSWGRDGFAAFVDSPARARAVVRDLVRDGVALVKLALEPAGGQPVLDLAACSAVVEAAHAAGLAVTAHALSVAMVERALAAGVDELAHTPTEVLAPPLVDRIASTGLTVVSTLATFIATGDAAGARANARALVAAGVPLAYGTDLGNAGTSAGVDPQELAELAVAGLGEVGALRAATEVAAATAGITGMTGRLAVGDPAALVVLAADPLVDPSAWRRPVVAVVGDRLTAF
jgi:imidazolonepropionase-like amidohydrolase